MWLIQGLRSLNMASRVPHLLKLASTEPQTLKGDPKHHIWDVGTLQNAFSALGHVGRHLCWSRAWGKALLMPPHALQRQGLIHFNTDPGTEMMKELFASLERLECGGSRGSKRGTHPFSMAVITSWTSRAFALQLCCLFVFLCLVWCCIGIFCFLRPGWSPARIRCLRNQIN